MNRVIFYCDVCDAEVKEDDVQRAIFDGGDLQVLTYEQRKEIANNELSWMVTGSVCRCPKHANNN